MRWAIDSLVALMLAGIVAGLVYHHRDAEEHVQNRDALHGDLVRFRKQIILHAALGQVEMSVRGFPLTIDPEWFSEEEGGIPQNLLLDDSHPWLEIAGPSQSNLLHPMDRVTAGRQAKFWYNPYTGDVRARVPASVSDSKSLELYNKVNGSNLTDLFIMSKVGDDELAAAESMSH